MKICIVRVAQVGHVTHLYDTIKQGAAELECNPRHLSDMLKGRRECVETPYGTIVKVTTSDGQANSPSSSIREYTDKPQENPAVGVVATHRGWTRLEQALVKVTSAVQWVFGKLHKP